MHEEIPHRSSLTPIAPNLSIPLECIIVGYRGAPKTYHRSVRFFGFYQFISVLYHLIVVVCATVHVSCLKLRHERLIPYFPGTYFGIFPKCVQYTFVPGTQVPSAIRNYACCCLIVKDPKVSGTELLVFRCYLICLDAIQRDICPVVLTPRINAVVSELRLPCVPTPKIKETFSGSFKVAECAVCRKTHRKRPTPPQEQRQQAC